MPGRHLAAVTATVFAALTSTLLCRLFVAWVLTSAPWDELFYVQWFVFLAFVALWSVVLFPRETRALADALASKGWFVPLAQLAVLAVVAALLVSCGDFAFEWAGASAMGTVLKGEVIWKRAWLTSSIILFAVYALTFAATSRLTTTVILISPVYLGFVIASVIKVNYMDTAVHPLDLLRIPEFVPFFHKFFGTQGIVAGVLASGLWLWGVIVTARMPAARVNRTVRWVIGVLAFGVLVTVPLAFSQVPISSSHEVLRLLGAPGRGFKEHARFHGVVLAFLSNLPAAFPARPDAYSAMAVEEALARSSVARGDGPETRAPVNLVLYLVESMIDPDDFGVRYTSDPIPTIRSLRRTFSGGIVIAPEAFGGSANTEFEILTGMSMCFLPQWSVAYRQYLRHPIPSLPSALKRAGYRATAIQADPKFFFARERAYDWLGFDEVRWLDDVPGIQRAAHGSSPSDAAVVDAIIEVSRRAEPFFIFAFPSSTHAPYNQGTFRDSALDVVDPIPAAARAELKEYINALSIADREIARLIEHFSHQRSPTMIVILGDHLPPLSSATRALFLEHQSGTSESDRSFRSRRVPLAVWANFEIPKEDVSFSANAMPSYLIRKLNLEPTHLLAVNDAVRRAIPVLGHRVPECGWGGTDARPLDSVARVLIHDYRLLQYDVLIGRNYSAAAMAHVSGDENDGRGR